MLILSPTWSWNLTSTSKMNLSRCHEDYLPSLVLSNSFCLSLPENVTANRIAQRAMNLSTEQKKMLHMEFVRVMAKSAALQRERAALLQVLDVRMTSDDGHSTERIAQARSPNTDCAVTT